MQGLKDLFRTMARVLGRDEPRADKTDAADTQAVAPLRQSFKVRHHNFKLLLAGNNEAMEAISRLEELARGAEPFGEHTLRAQVSHVVTLAYRAIKRLEAVTESPQPHLAERFHDIKGELDELMRRPEPRRDGPLVLDLLDLSKQDVDLAGPKMARLGEAARVLETPAPPGFVVTVSGFETFMAQDGLGEEIRRRIQARGGELAARMQLAQELQSLIIQTPLPPPLREAIMAAYEDLATRMGRRPRLAVRSSALGEDSVGASFAGQFRTAVNVSPESLPHVYREIVASAYSLEALSYRLTKGVPDESAAMAVGVLAMLAPQAGGVAYSRDPLGLRNDAVLVYSCFGLPKQMVDGADAVDFFAIGREHDLVLEHDIGLKTRRTVCLPEEGVCKEELTPELADQSSIDAKTAQTIAHLALDLERHFGEPQDMEWALNDDGRVFILQTRPLLTTMRRTIRTRDLVAETEADPREIARGVTASGGAAAGPVHHLRREADMLTMPADAILVTQRPLPRFAPALVNAAALVAEEGGPAGHLASVAREMGKPALFSVVDALNRLEQGALVTVDADAMMILEGRAEDHLDEHPAGPGLMHGAPVHERLMKALPHIASLTLLDPQSGDFNAVNCRTLHDIFRYCHETALLAMFDFGKDNPFPDRAAKLLFGGKSSQFKVIDLEDAFQGRKQGDVIAVEDIDSPPFQAFWEGMMRKPWAGPPAVRGRGLAAIFHEAMMNPGLETSQPSPYAAQNYFMVARDFLSGQSRFGFHFASVEALVGRRSRENYVSFQFKGGAANERRREARAAMIGALLEDLGFEVKRTLDALKARVDNQDADFMTNRLVALGHLTMHTRQLDMVMGDPALASAYRRQLAEELAAIQPSLAEAFRRDVWANGGLAAEQDASGSPHAAEPAGAGESAGVGGAGESKDAVPPVGAKDRS